jgi:hypothetical protein
MYKFLPFILAACASSQVGEVSENPGLNGLLGQEEPDGDTGEISEPDPGAEDSARIHYEAFPSEINCGESAVGYVIMENTGTATWTYADGYKLGALNDQDPLFDSGDVRVWLDEGDVVAPGERHSFEIALIGPESVGTKRTDWRMVHEGVHWFGEVAEADVLVTCEDEDTGGNGVYPLPLPDMSDVVVDVANEYPAEFANNCAKEDGNYDWLEILVDRLRETDERWGFNWKRGVVGDASHDVVDYHHGPGIREGSTDVYPIDVIVASCSGNPSPGWTDQTQATADAGTVGKWTGRGLF